MTEKKNPVFSIFQFIFSIVVLVIVILVLGVGLLTILEYQPLDKEEIELTPASTDATGESVSVDDKLSLLTWNIGYCGLSETADFFMDGGTSVVSQDEQAVRNNLLNIEKIMEKEDTDITFIQEVDRDSARTYGIDEAEDIMKNAFPERAASFATNFKVIYIPYPIPPIGHMNSGILTLSKYDIASSERIQLPVPFKWPVRTVNIKRCLDVCRMNVKGTDKKLVLINVHLEAYDGGQGKVEQTRQLAEFMQQEYDMGNFVIAGGDFNQYFESVDISAYPKQNDSEWESGVLDEEIFSENFRFCMDPSVPTCRSLSRPYDANDESFQHYMLDGFIVSDNLTVEAVETKDYGFKYSDHNPVKLVVSFNNEEE